MDTTIVNNSSSSSAVTPSLDVTTPVCKSNDDLAMFYLPSASIPTVVFRLNYIFLTSPSFTTPWGNTSIQQLSVDAGNGITSMNNWLQNAGTYTSTMPTAVNSPTFADTKVRFTLNNVYKVNSNLAVTSEFGNHSLFENSLPYDTSSALNLYFYVDTSDCGAAWAIYGKGTGIAHCRTQAAGTASTGDHLILHELLHVVGYLKDHYYYYPPTNSHMLQFLPNNEDPANGYGYLPDDAGYDIAPYNCTLPFNIVSNPINNNFMGNSSCRQHLSAKQVAAIHYLVARNKTKKFTQYSNTSYPYAPPTPPASVTLSGTQTLTAIPSFLDELRIVAGSKITIIGASYKTYHNSKIIVEPGAKLTLKCVSIDTRLPSTIWKGIEVWGNTYLPQSILQNGLSPGQGYLELFDCYISMANIAVLVGQRQPQSWNYWNFTSGTGGGIITASNTVFMDNQIAVNMLPKASGAMGAARENLATFRACVFKKNELFNSYFSAAPNVEPLVKLDGVREVLFLGNKFDFGNPTYISNVDTGICILGINSSIIAKKDIQYYTNDFGNAYYGIYLTNSYGSIIDNNVFRTRNSIYLNNCLYSKIVNNELQLAQNLLTNIYGNGVRTGLYLNHCSYYKVENNLIRHLVHIIPKIYTQAICVNDGGPISTLIYNNTLKEVSEGIWCQGLNHNPNSPFKEGLVMNCNKFQNCVYDIGVQTPYFPYYSTAGIAKTQGAVSSTSYAAHCRNQYIHTYTPTCSNDDRFYSSTPFCVPHQVQHGSFTNAEYRITPQPGCSEVSEARDTALITAPFNNNFALLCPNTSTLSYSNAALSEQVTLLNSQISAMQLEYSHKLDGNNTYGLLNYIEQNSLSLVALRDTLRSKTYLSDTIMISYLKKSNLPAEHITQVFAKNAPVENHLWERINKLQLSQSVLDTLQFYQNTQKPSLRYIDEQPVALAIAERSRLITQKGIGFYEDTLRSHLKDSLAMLIELNNQGDIAKEKIELDLYFRDFDAASTKLAAYNTEGNETKQNYVKFKQLFIQLMLDSSGLRSILYNNDFRAAVEDIANIEDHPCVREAQDILFNVYSSHYRSELKLTPESGLGERLYSIQKTNKSEIGKNFEEVSKGLINRIKLYPNPASSELYIENYSQIALDTEIYNFAGQVVLRQKLIEGQINKIDTKSLLSGIYFVNLFNGKTLIKSGKLIISK